MSFVADVGGGGARVPTSLATVTPPQQQPVNTGESDAAARARELQRQLEALLEKLREAQRRAEEARKRAIAAQHKAEQAKKAEETAKALAEKTKSPVDQAAEKKAEQNTKLQDARLKKESADADLQDKKVALLKAQVAQKKEQKKNTDGQATPEADQKVKLAQDHRDDAQRTSDRSNLYADYQEKETKAQDAEAKVIKLTPAPGRPSATITDAESQALETAKTKATKLRSEADDAKTDFTTAVGAQAQTEFFGDAPAAPSSTQPTTQTAVLPNDPLHSPLQQLLQVSPRPSGQSLFLPLLTPPDLKATPLAPTDTATSSPLASQDTLFPTKDPVVTPDVTKTLSSIADGKSVEQIAKERGVGTDKVIAEAKAAGIQLESSTPSTDVQRTTVKRGDATLTYTNDMHSGTVTVKGSFADPKAPGERRTIEASQDGNGRFSQTVKDDKTGDTTTHVIDTQAGTRTDIVVGADGKRTETTTDLTGATVRRPVKEGEDYLDVAKAAGLTPEQLLALNPDVDYGKLLKPGQQMVVTGVPTTVKTYNADGSTLEETTASDGSLTAVATSASGRRTVLMGEPDAKDGQGEAVRKAIFDDKKTVADVAKSMGLTQDQVLDLLPPGTVDKTPASSDTSGIETRTLFDPTTNRAVVETLDPRHDRYVRQDIDDKTVFKVRQYDPETKKYVIAEVEGGVGYLQKLADDKLALVGDYDKQISDLDFNIRFGKRLGEPVNDLLDQRKQLVAQRDTAKGESGIAQARATSGLLKNQQVKLDNIAANAYQRQFVARPGSKEQQAATQDLNDILALTDKVDRLVKSGDKDVEFLIADLDRNQKHTAKVDADENLQTTFHEWKEEVWMWQNVDDETKKNLQEDGLRPNTRIFSSLDEENKVAWEAFTYQQESWDKYGDEGLTGTELAARNAWVARNQAGTAEVESNDTYFKVSIEKGNADAHMIQGDVDRLQAKKDAWYAANPKDFSENFPAVKGEHGGQKELDGLNDQLTQLKVGVVLDGKSQKYNNYVKGLSIEDREDPDKLKEANQEYGEKNAQDIEADDQKVNDLLMDGLRKRAKASDDYVAQWTQDNPELQGQLDALSTKGITNFRMVENRLDERQALLDSTHQFRQLRDALAMQVDTKIKLTQIGDQDVARVQKDLNGIDKTVDGQTWLRDVFSDTAEDSQSWTKAQRDEAKKLRDDLAAGNISLTDYTKKQDELMDSYGVKSVDIGQDLQDSNETWSIVDEAVRMTVTAAAGIAATIATGGNIAAGIAVGVAVNQLWDTSNDAYAAANGRDIYADGHSSMVTLGGRAVFDQDDLTRDQVMFTLKDDAIDTAHAVVSATGVGAGMRTSAALTSRIALRKGVDLGAGETLKLGSRVAVGSTSGTVAQAVDGAGRVGVESLHVKLDGKWGTDEGSQRISGTVKTSLAGLITAPVTGAISGALPMHATKIFTPTLGGQFLNDATSALGAGQLSSYMIDGRGMNQAQLIAASLQSVPGTMTSVALHPSRINTGQRAPSGEGFAADGTALPPSVLGRGRTWEDVANRVNGLIHRQDLASQPGSTIRGIQPTAGETAVLKWLTADPHRHAGTRFVVSASDGPAKTIYGDTALGVQRRDTFKTFEEASKAAAERGGGWVHRVQPSRDHTPLFSRATVGADEIVGAVHVNPKGDVLPIGIPNSKHGVDMVTTGGRPGWLGPAKAVVRPISGPTKFLTTVVAAQGSAITAKMFGAGPVFDNVTGGAWAAWANQTRGLGTRAAYFTGKRGLENALDMASRGETAEALAQVNVVANRRALRGLSPEEIKNKKQPALDQLGQFGDASNLYLQGAQKAGVPASVTEAFPIKLLTEAEIKAGNKPNLPKMDDGELVSNSRAAQDLLTALNDPTASPAKQAEAVDAYRTQLALDQMGQISSPVQQRIRDAFADPQNKRLPESDRAEIENALGGPGSVDWGPVLPARVAQMAALADASGGALSPTQQRQAADVSTLQPDTIRQLVAAREGEVGYGIARDMVNKSGNLINMKDVQGALGSTMHMGSQVGFGFKYGALGFAANSGLSGTYNFVKHLVNPQRADKPLIEAFGHPGIKGAALSGEVVGNVPNIAIQWNYLMGLLRRTNFSDASANSKVPMAKVEAYVDKRITRMSNLAEGHSVSLRDLWNPLQVVKFRIGWGTLLKAVPKSVQANAQKLIDADVDASNIAKAANKPEPEKDLRLVKHILLRKAQAEERVKTLEKARQDAVDQGDELILRKAAKTESEVAAKSMNTAGDFMAIPSMFRYTMMAIGASNPAVAAVTVFHGIVSNGGWLRSQQGKGTIYGLKMAPGGLYEGNGLFWVGKRFGRGYNMLLDKLPDGVGQMMASGAKKLPLVGSKVKTDNLVETLKLGPTAEDAANRRRIRLLVTGAVAPTFSLLYKLLWEEKKEKPMELQGGNGVGPWNTGTHPSDPTRTDTGFTRVTPESMPELQPVYATVDGSQAPTRTLWGMAGEHVGSLFADPASFQTRVETSADTERNPALAQLFNLNPQFNPKLNDGEVTNAPGDPDTLLNGWQVQVGERWVTA